jgi:SPP1 gp7 family putative phage head morphogenesis protein
VPRRPPKRVEFRPAQRIEVEFRRSIQRLLLQYLHIPENATIETILEKINSLAADSPLLEKLGTLLSSRMVSQVNTANYRSWREAAAESSRGREIFTALQAELRNTPVGAKVRELVRLNAGLISSIPVKIRESVNLEVAGFQREGLRAEEIVKHLRARVPELTRSRAALIARTETGKAAEALTQVRATQLGIPAYVWETAKDQRVRKSHKLMHGVIVFWDDMPSPELLAHEESEGHYNAGGIYNCRCTALPILRPEFLSWPHRVYRFGKITSMSLKQFRGLYEAKQAA